MVEDDGTIIVRDWVPPSAQDVQTYWMPGAPRTGELVEIAWELPGTQLNVCDDVYVDPSTTIEPAGFAVTITEMAAVDDVMLVELVVALVVVVVVVACVLRRQLTCARVGFVYHLTNVYGPRASSHRR